MNVLPPGSSGSSRRVLLFSLHDLVPAPWNGVIYEFMDVVRRMEDATLVAPVVADPYNRSFWKNCRKTMRNTLARLLARAAMPTASEAPRTEVEGDFDLTFYACQFPHEIREINCVPGWRKRTRKACIFLLETWSRDVEKLHQHYRHLDMFDHVFVFNAGSVPLIQRHTRTPVTYLPTAVDTLLLPASRYTVSQRCVDYVCIGRRLNRVHGRMLELCGRDNRFYVFDLWRGMKAKDWDAVRLQNADLAARARHYVVWKPVKGTGAAAETTLTTRYFEGASSGAVMIGSTPDIPEFKGLFSSPEAIVNMPTDPDRTADFLEQLEADADRYAAIARANRLDVLSRHDWAHRWAEMLAVLGLASSPGLDARLAELRRRHAVESGAEPHLIEVRLPAAMPAAAPTLAAAASNPVSAAPPGGLHNAIPGTLSGALPVTIPGDAALPDPEPAQARQAH